MSIIGTRPVPDQTLVLDTDGWLRLRHYDQTGDYTFTLWLGDIEREPDVPDHLIERRDELLKLWLSPAWTVADARAEVLDVYRRGVGL